MNADSLSRLLQEFLSEAAHAAVLEEGEEIFRFTDAQDSTRYSITSHSGKCLLHLWSSERNLVRRVLEAEQKKESLLLSVQRFGRAKPARMELLRNRDRRLPSAQKAARSAYLPLLKRALERHFPDWSCGRLTSAIDLEHSFGPIYARGVLHRGRSAFAVLGVNAQETQASIDAALTFGLLWLEHCRQRELRLVVEGLMLFLPSASSAVVRERMACLNHAAAKFRLHEFEEREQRLTERDCRDRGNIATRLVRCVDQQSARQRFEKPLADIAHLVPEVAEDLEMTALSPAEIACRWRGLEFARVRLAPRTATLRSEPEIVFGAGHNEMVLQEETTELFCSLVQQVVASRRPEGTRADALWRMQPERWLESLVKRDVAVIDSSLETEPVYSQVPAFSASDRAMIDVLALTRENRLAVLELKADEDIHLPLQGLDYWARVAWHHVRGEFQQFGYFPGRELSPLPPLLYLVAPTLRVHPATDTLLRYFAPDIDYALAGIDERWREGVKVVFRKRNK